MAIISQTDKDFQQSADTLSFFLRTFHIASLLRAVGAGFSKNAFYRFLNNASINWTKFTIALSALIAAKIRPLTKENRADAFIIDDTMYERTSVKRTELAARVFDHNEHRFKI